MDENQLAERFITQAPDVTETDPDFEQPEIVDENEDGNSYSHSESQIPQGKTESPRVDTRLKDSGGNNFDSSIHIFDEITGKPKLTKTGKFRKKPGRKTSTGDGSAQSESKRLSCREAGKVSAEGVFLIGQSVFGEEWKPVIDPETGINEPENLTTAFAAYYEATGFRDPPPWLMLVMGLGAYAGPRLAAPKTQGKLKRFTQWIGLRLTGWRKKSDKVKDGK